MNSNPTAIMEPTVEPVDLSTYEERAIEILDEGTAYEYLLDTWQKLHCRNRHIGKLLIASIPVIFNAEARGLHIVVHGEKGSGKSDSTSKAMELIPARYGAAIEPTAQAYFYNPERFKPNMHIKIDDILFNNMHGSSLKKITSEFQRETEKISVDGTKGKEGVAPPRLNFWLTCVDFQPDEQVRDRFIAIETENTPEYRQQQSDFITEQRAGYLPTVIDLTEEIEVCRSIVQLLGESDYRVDIPFRREFVHIGGARSKHQLFDLIDSFAIYRHKIRDKSDEGHIIADRTDYTDAADIFNEIGGFSGDKLSSREQAIVDAILDQAEHSCSFKDLQILTGSGYQSVRNVIYGRSDDPQNSGGLLEKMNGALTISDGSPKILRIDPSHISQIERTYWLNES